MRRMVIHDRAPGHRPLGGINAVAAGMVDCLTDVDWTFMYIQAAIDAGAEVCGRCMPRPDAIAYDIRVEYIEEEEATMADVKIPTFVAHIKIEEVTHYPNPLGPMGGKKMDREVSEVGQVTVRALSLEELHAKVNAACGVVCGVDNANR